MYKKYIIGGAVFAVLVSLVTVKAKLDTFAKKKPDNNLEHLPLVTSSQLIAKYGEPKYKVSNGYCHIALPMPHIVNWTIPYSIKPSMFPSSIIVNRDFIPYLEQAFIRVQERDLDKEIVEYNGCFCIRKKKGGSTWSVHAFAMAVDINASTNAFGAKPTMSAQLVKCFTDAGFTWGGRWSYPDGMHFQIAQLT